MREFRYARMAALPLFLIGFWAPHPFVRGYLIGAATVLYLSGALFGYRAQRSA